MIAASEQDWRWLQEAGASIGAAPLEPEATVALARGIALLQRFNARTNLVGDAAARAVLQEHVLPTLAVAAAVEEALGEPPSSVIDVGAGAGLEAAVLALLWPTARLVAMEPRRKRADFIELLADRVGVGARLEVVRAPLDPRYEGPRFSAATSRATFAPAEWLGRCAPLLAEGGLAVVHGRAGELPTAWGPPAARRALTAKGRVIAVFQRPSQKA